MPRYIDIEILAGGHLLVLEKYESAGMEGEWCLGAGRWMGEKE